MALENVSTLEQVDEDLSLMQQSMLTALSGFQEANKAFEDGTEEVRHLLLHECSLIYECNICRNLFRSFANFISHKRAFCSKSGGSNRCPKRFSEGNSTVIVHTKDMEKPAAKSASSRSTPIPDAKAAKATTNTKDLCKVIERLRREKGSTDVENKDTILHLESVPTSSNAVYQTVQNDEEVVESMRTEVNEVYDLLNNKYTEVGPDGKAITKHQYNMNNNTTAEASEGGGSLEPTADSYGDIFCETCNLGFQTEKTLEMHRQKKHISTTFVYLCTDCSLTFLRPAKVMHHLVNDHMKSRRRVRNMREGIIRRRIKQCDVPQVKNGNRELKRLKLDSDGKEKGDNADNASAEVLPKCIYCGETFKRNAALATHIANCPQRKEDQQKQASKFVPAVNLQEKAAANTFLHNNNNDDSNNKLEMKVEENEYNADIVPIKMFKMADMKTVSLDRMDMSDLSNSDNSNASLASNESVFNVSTKSDINESLTGINDCSNSYMNYNSRLATPVTFNGYGLDGVGSILPHSNINNNCDENYLQEAKIKQEFTDAQPIHLLNNFHTTNGIFESNILDQTDLDEIVDSKNIDTENIDKEIHDNANIENETDCLDNESVDTPPKSDCSEDTTSLKVKRKRVSEKLTSCLCRICNKKFNTISNVKRHISMFHFRPKRFKCELCEYEALRKHDVVNHLGLTHNMTESRDVLFKDYVKPFDTTYTNKDMEATIVMMSEEEENSDDDSKPKGKSPRISNGKAANQTTPKGKNKNLKQLTTPIPMPSSSATAASHMGAPLKASSPNAAESLSPTPEDNQVSRLKVKRNILKKEDLLEETPVVTRKKANNSVSIEKRPTRRRSKPVNNDFVYDSVKGVKKEVLVKDEEETPISTTANSTKQQAKKKLTKTKSLPIEVKAKPQRRREKPVANAVSVGIVPKIPLDRIKIPQRLPPNSNVKQAGPIIDSEDLEAARLNTPLLADVFFEEFTKNSNGSTSSFKVKPCLESSHKTLTTFLETIQNKSRAKSMEYIKAKEEEREKMKILESLPGGQTTSFDSGINRNQQLLSKSFDFMKDIPVVPIYSGNGIGNVITKPLTEGTSAARIETENNNELLGIKSDVNNKTECFKSEEGVTDIVNSEYQTNDVDDADEKSKIAFSAMVPKRRYTLMQQLAENKQRKKQSILRSALENPEQIRY